MSTKQFINPKLQREDHGTPSGVLNQIYNILHRRQNEFIINISIYDLVDYYSTCLLKRLSKTKYHFMIRYKIAMIKLLTTIFEIYGSHFGVEDTFLIVNSNVV